MLVLIRLFNDYLGFPLRRRYLLRYLLPMLPEQGHILDLGCGDGKLAVSLMKKRPGLRIEGADVFPQPDCSIPLTRIEKEPYPFEDSSFDVVMLIDVLHHSNQPESVLKEAVRISRHTILIKDHYYNSGLGFFLLKISDYWGNKPYGISLPYHFLRFKEWDALLSGLPILLKKVQRFRYNFSDPCRHHVMLLQKSGEQA